MTIGMSQINVPPPGLSMGADIYRQYRLGEITREDYMTFSAAMVANLCHEERPKIYGGMPGPVKAYTDGRLFGGHGYDRDRSRQLGLWRYDTFKALDDNLYLVEHFNWALGKVMAVKLNSEGEKLRNAIRRFDALRFPHDSYKHACDVLKMDSDDKRKGGA